MDKVVILARVSTDKQEYERQLVELRDYCAKVGWEVVREFANKVSGVKRNEERPEIVELIEFVKSNDIRRVVCLEISRLGRNTLEALRHLHHSAGGCINGTPDHQRADGKRKKSVYRPMPGKRYKDGQALYI